MLEYLRNAAEKPVAKILIGILAFSFVGWGAAEWIFGNVAGDNTIMYVGDTDVSAQQFNAEKSRALAKMSREDQRLIYADENAQSQFAHDIWARLATQQMAENRAHDLGLMVSDKRIAREIREFDEFKDEGVFSSQKFDQVLYNSGYSEAEFADVLRGQILRSQILGAMDVALPVPEFAVVANYNARYATRDIEYVTVKYSDFRVENPTDEQLETFYKQNPVVVPETRAVSYVFIPTDMAKPDMYDAGYATAVKVEDDIIAGESMSAAAKKHGVKYVSITDFARGDKLKDNVLNDVIVSKIFDMEPEIESEMIETKDGFLFVRVDAITPEHTAEFDSVKKSLISDWKKSEQKKQAYVRANELLVDMNKTGKLAGAKAANVSRTNGAPNDVLVASFKNEIGQNAIVPGADAFYVVGVKKATAPQVDKKKMNALRQEMQGMTQNMIQNDYDSFLKREYPVQINDKIYNRVFGK